MVDTTTETAEQKRKRQTHHWKSIAKEFSDQLEEAKKEIARLRANGGAEPIDLAKIKAESFAAGVAAASQHFSRG